MNYHEIKLLARKLRNRPTPCESRLWQEIRDRQLDGYKFLRQHPILCDRKGNNLKIFIPDFYCPEARLAIEIDGKIHMRQKEHDRWRAEILTKMKISVLRICNEDLEDIDNVIKEISTRLISLAPGTSPGCIEGVCTHPKPLPTSREGL